MNSKFWRSLFLLGLSSLLIYAGFYVVDALTTVRFPSTRHPTEIYANQMQADLRMTMVRAIESAKKSVTLVIYSLSDPRVIRALNEKAQEGIPVAVVCDPNGSKSALFHLSDQVHLKKERAKGLMHQKILVIDGEKVWIGSANMTTESLRLHGNLIVGVHSEDLAHFIEEKAKNMQERHPSKEVRFGKQSVTFFFLPDEKEGAEKLIQLIQAAKKTVRIALFTWTHKGITDAVIAAHQRGVHVEAVVDRYSGSGAGRAVVQLLRENQIPISLSQGQSLLHHKMVLIDEETLVTGSANWTKAAFKNNNDCFLVLSALNSQQQKYLHSLWSVIKSDSLPSE